jgi:hypothetical protein
MWALEQLQMAPAYFSRRENSQRDLRGRQGKNKRPIPFLEIRVAPSLPALAVLFVSI